MNFLKFFIFFIGAFSMLLLITWALFFDAHKDKVLISRKGDIYLFYLLVFPLSTLILYIVIFGS
jgi:hypothetical protein